MSDVLGLLLELNAAMVLAVMIVLALRTPARRVFGPRAAYGLWGVVPLTLAAVCLPRMAVDPVAASSTLSLIPAPLLVGVWGAGVIVFAGLMAAQQMRFAALARQGLAGPAVTGVIVPRLVMPADSAVRWSQEERALILAHEHAHLERGDLRVNAAVALLQCLFWCNPWAHVAAGRFRFDQELACDAQVLAVRPGRRRVYAEALLKAGQTRVTPLGCGWSDASGVLEARIASFRLNRHSPTPVAVAVVLGLALGVAAAAWALQPATVENASDSRPKILNLRLGPPQA
ncbi:M56 family metallopeptidase [Brevundimonas sp. NPDC003935]|uniref:M56 family metallopeptidase n=1 Tax=unclassified Brevundimonas TaxID=2622653 RepID=UPI00289F0414|nr:M56 family metallopeptidase [Brevundimonas sp.]